MDSIIFIVKDDKGNFATKSISITIKPSANSVINITSPVGGENWHIGETHNITWTSTDVKNVYIYLVYYSSTNKQDFSAEEPIATVPASQGTYSWTIQNQMYANGASILNPAGQTFKILINEAGTSTKATSGATSGFFNITQSLNQTSAWQTYTNNDYGFQINYPAGTKLFDAIGTAGIDNTSEIDFTPASSNTFLQIQITTADLLSNPAYSYPKCPRTEYTHTNTAIDGMNFFESDVSNDYRSMNNQNAVDVEYCIMGNNGDKYALIVNAYNPPEIISEMMNTFKFTK